MRLDAAFRLSTYLSLVLASVCLGYADQLFLPQMAVFGAVMSLVLAVAFVLEGRWALSLGAANALGLAIAAGAGFWIAYHALQPLEAPESGITHPAMLLPYLGPVLMVIVAAKLFRPKQVNDFWGLHSIGLLEVLLACVLASEPLFGLLLLAYLGSLVWSLMLFQLYRGRLSAGVAASSRPAIAASREPAGLPWRWLGLLPGGGWTVSVLVVGMSVFLLTPQRGNRRWDPKTLTGLGGGGMQTGFSTEIDLNRTGDLEVNEDVALEVYAENADGSPKLDLGAEQRWRGATADWYSRGRWTNRTSPETIAWDGPRLAQLPSLGAGQFFLTFTIKPHRLSPMFLAEPVIVEPAWNVVPVVFLEGQRIAPSPAGVMVRQDGLLWPVPSFDRGQYRYRQVTRPLLEPELSARVDPQEIDEYSLCQAPVPRIAERTAEILDQMLARGKLRERQLQTVPARAALSEPRGRPGAAMMAILRPAVPDRVLRPDNREQVARALCSHLALSGEFAYTLAVRREDPQVDPVEDFLCNGKQGPCERFAAALALMLRSQGIPARVVLGFRGADSQGGGRYLVRHSHAHSWVEALVRRHGNELHWLELDPTPATETLLESPASWSAWQLGQFEIGLCWRNYVLDYNVGQQTETSSAVWRQAAALAPWSGGTAGTLGFWARLGTWVLALLGGWLLIRFARRWRLRPRVAAAAGTTPAGFYGRLLGVLARRLRLSPRPPQTPREFGASAARALEQRTTKAGLAQVPGQVVCLFYRVRYGHLPLTSAEHQEVDRRIGEVDAALVERSRG
ncbi:MAG TPA: transglutaminase domain-containing protein [Gemmataceae bacterium]|jgi:hypothetical protein|nr:transglutaminase domain-containing protein [Gemmataceae bacterium]